MSSEQKRTKGIQRAFQILDCLVEIQEPATAYTIAKKIKAPLSTVYQAIATLQQMGVLAQVKESGKYFLGDRLYLFGLAFVRNSNKGKVYLRAVKALADAMGYDAFMCIRDAQDVVVVARTPGRDELRVSIKDGSRIPLDRGGPGLFLVGHLAPEERAEIWRAEMSASSVGAPKKPAELESLCQEYWRQGFCVIPMSSGFDISCVGVPVKTWQGKCIAALCVLVPSDMVETRRDELLAKLSDVEESIRKDLGWVDGFENHDYM